jgi:hypothetical protein
MEITTFASNAMNSVLYWILLMETHRDTTGKHCLVASHPHIEKFEVLFILRSIYLGACSSTSSGPQ